MSENRRVIRVKDLVIEAENVIIEQRRRHHDPIFGGVRREDDRMESSSSHRRESVHRDEEHGRGPFSWI